MNVTNRDWEAQIDAALAAIQGEFEQDVRAVPDAHRRGRFRLGWHDAALRGKDYSAATMANLTWHNLGFRLGKRLGMHDDAQIFQAFARAVQQLSGASEAQAESGPLDAAEVAAAGFFAPTQEDRRLAKQHMVLERKIRAIRECLARDSWTCQVCGVRLRERYGLSSDLAEAHHVAPLQLFSAPGRVAVHAEDLLTVCPNCHRAIHRLGCTADAIARLRRQFSVTD